MTVTNPASYAQSVTELLTLRAATNPDDPYIHTGAPEFGNELRTLTYGDTLKAIDRLCAHYAKLGLPRVSDAAVPPEQVIGVLTLSTVDETLLAVALGKLGLTPLLLSPNNSVAAVAHLLKQTKASHLIYGARFEETAQQAQKALADEGYTVAIVPERKFPLWGPGGVREAPIAAYPARLKPEDEAHRTAVIIHSSGSTGFPKPISWTHSTLIYSIGLLGTRQNDFTPLPLFHAFGHCGVLLPLYHAKAVTLLPPHLPATAANIIRTIKTSPSPPKRLFSVPQVLATLAEDEAGLQLLKEFGEVIYAGAPLAEDLGDRLVAAGVHLASVMGATETGPILSSLRDYATDKNWSWMRPLGPAADFLELAPQGSDTVELIVGAGWPARNASNRDDGAYATKDLYLVHPQHPTWLKYAGRLDDTINMSLGEKTNPVPIELAIRGKSQLIDDCIVFGNGRPQVGVLLMPSERGAALTKDELIDQVWPVIKDANRQAPSHSRIEKDMIDVIPFGTDVPRTPKKNFLRAACYKKFAPMINALYDNLEKGSGERQVIKDRVPMVAFLRAAVVAALGDKPSDGLEDEADLFQFGVDSLAASRIRNDIVKKIDLGGKNLGQNVVYEHPSIAQLADFLLGLQAGATDKDRAAQTHATMVEMVDAWMRKVVSPAEPNEQLVAATHGQVVVLTGATGSLGAHILDQLARRDDVERIVCLSRAKSDADSLRRIQDSLKQRGRHNVDMSKVVSLAADVNKTHLGLTPEVYERIRNNATCVMHIAWPVNFNYALESFAEHIGGTVNLVNLTLDSPRAVKPELLFASSVSVTLAQHSVVKEEYVHDPAAAVMGYGQSKWVCERILERVGAEKGGRVGVLRIGQMVGDTENGIWNETESWPLMFRSATVTGALPDLSAEPDWIPVDQAARIIVDIAAANYSWPSLQTPHADMFNVLNPHRGAWADVLRGLEEGGLRFERVARDAWLSRLEQSNPDPSVNPSIKLVPFWKAGIEGGPPGYTFDKVAQLSPTVATLKPVDHELARKWIQPWKQSGFIKA